MSSFAEYGFFGALLAVGLLMGLAPVIIPLLISPRSRGLKTGETYECGMDTIGSAWVRFGISFYLFALIFVAFEVDVLYLLPVALVFDDGTYAWRDLVEVSLFVGILSLGILYAWHKGVFRPEAIRPAFAPNGDAMETPPPRSER